MNTTSVVALLLAFALSPLPTIAETSRHDAVTDLLAGHFRWKVSPPLVGAAARASDPCYSVKDPSVVYHDGRWHLFCTIRSQKRSHQIEYLSFADWKDANKAERHILTVSTGYFCAPQVFHFEPHRKWYMVLQVPDPTGRPVLQPAVSTTDDLSKPASWSKPVLMYDEHPANVKAWIDFWVIGDEHKAHLFFTSNDGRMWRAETKLADFPKGWGKPEVAIQGDIFEASATYNLKGTGKYLTIVEAQRSGPPGTGWRYYKAYLADRLEGPWTGLADTWDKPFAAPGNIDFAGGAKWTDSISHGELLRAGIDQRLEVDPANLRFLFQGVLDQDRAGKPYGQIPWKLGLLERAR